MEEVRSRGLDGAKYFSVTANECVKPAKWWSDDVRTNRVNLGFSTSQADWLVLLLTLLTRNHLTTWVFSSPSPGISFIDIHPQHTHYALGQRETLGGISFTSTSARDPHSHLAICCRQGRYVDIDRSLLPANCSQSSCNVSLLEALLKKEYADA